MFKNVVAKIKYMKNNLAALKIHNNATVQTTNFARGN